MVRLRLEGWISVFYSFKLTLTEAIYAHAVEKWAKITPVGVHLTLVILLCSWDWYIIYIDGEVRNTAIPVSQWQ